MIPPQDLDALLQDARLDLLIDLEHTVVRTFLEETDGMDTTAAAKLLTEVVLNMEECFSPKSESPDFV